MSKKSRIQKRKKNCEKCGKTTRHNRKGECIPCEFKAKKLAKEA